MSLKSRLEKLESQAESEPEVEPVNPEFEAYWQFITSGDFISQIIEKANTILATMSDESIAIIKSDCDAVVENPKRLYTSFHPMTEIFEGMLSAALEGRYYGPLSLPENVMAAYKKHWAYAWGGIECLDCNYCFPSYEEFGMRRISHEHRDYSNIRCPLCGGLSSGSTHGYYFRDTNPIKVDSKLPFTYHRARIRKVDLLWILGKAWNHDGQQPS